MAWAYSVDLRERVMSALGTRRTARLRNSSKLARPRSTPMEATASGDGQPGAASPQEREPNAGAPEQWDPVREIVREKPDQTRSPRSS